MFTSANQCARPGCKRIAPPEMSYCTVGCRTVALEIASAHRLRDNLGESDLVDQYLAAAERLAAAWATVQNRRYELRRRALDAGFEPQQWSALLRGHGAADPPPAYVNHRPDADTE